MTGILRGEQVLLRPVSADDVEELRRIRGTPEVMRWWGEGSAEAPDWPLDADPGETGYAVVVAPQSSA